MAAAENGEVSQSESSEYLVHPEGNLVLLPFFQTVTGLMNNWKLVEWYLSLEYYMSSLSIDDQRVLGCLIV